MQKRKSEMEKNQLKVIGARVHNLQNIHVKIPRNQLVVITGLSGSGKSSLAFDTIYAEGQRRYIETFSSYARGFLSSMERPDVDKIDGLSPVISIEQKTVNKNPRSTVGTITEVYDFLRLLFARGSEAFSFNTGEKMVKYSDDEIVRLILNQFNEKDILILAPVVKGRKGHYRELFEQIQKQGFLKARVDGEIVSLKKGFKVDRYKTHDIEIVIDCVTVNKKNKKRLSQSCQIASKRGRGSLIIYDIKNKEEKHYSRQLMCPTTDISYDDPAPNNFSFNSPYGACLRCNGLGEVSEIDRKKIIPDASKTIQKGGIAPLGTFKNNWIFKQVEAILTKYQYTLNTPIKEIEENVINKILEGTDESLKINSGTGVNEYMVNFEGILSFITRTAEEKQTKALLKWAITFMNKVECPVCEGTRLKKAFLFFKINEKNIADLARMNIGELSVWLEGIEKKISLKQQKIAKPILKEVRSRIHFLLSVGLDYLSLNRSARTLSGGEAQRIRLATQIGAKLVGVLYILDEPSIGLHQRDNQRLINSLKELKQGGNSVIVVEHDKDMILEGDYFIDIGPGAGRYGGNIVAEGPVTELKSMRSLTIDYLFGRKSIEVPKKRRKGSGKSITIKNAHGNNLTGIDVKFPLGKFICVTGVSGSGKSSLINQTLYPYLSNYFYRSEKKILPFGKITGIEHIDKIIEIDQSPIGRTPRSNPATYTGVFSEIRDLFANLPESKIRGYKQGRFSFNVKTGRCETCEGAGLRTIEMNFLPDVYVNCESCNGNRYNRETLEVRYKGKSIADVLNMTINTAVEFFSEIPKIQNKIKTLYEVGLGYITLGQSSTTLSGGEAQRVKLSTELSKKGTGNTFYILDEPSTGLHFEDIRLLIGVLNRLVDNGNTVLVIEHNMDIIKVADHLIDIGPDGGNRGGEVVFTGTPEKMISENDGFTSQFLQKELN